MEPRSGPGHLQGFLFRYHPMQILKQAAARISTLSGPARGNRVNHKTTMMHTRQFVDFAVLKLLEQTCVGRASIDAFRFQESAQCTFNAAGMREHVTGSLLDGRAMTKDASKMVQVDQSLLYRLLVGTPQTHGRRILEHPSVADIVELNRRQGPVTLTMQKLIQPGQGDDQYPVHHAAVLIATLMHEGRHVGVLVDGNNLQSNDAMTEVERYLRENGDRRELFDLKQHDFKCINAAINRDRQDRNLDVMQLGFRLVDLDSVVEASAKKFVMLRELDPYHEWMSNSVGFDVSLELQGDPLPTAAADELLALMKENPSMIERFD